MYSLILCNSKSYYVRSYVQRLEKIVETPLIYHIHIYTHI